MKAFTYTNLVELIQTKLPLEATSQVSSKKLADQIITNVKINHIRDLAFRLTSLDVLKMTITFKSGMKLYRKYYLGGNQ